MAVLSLLAILVTAWLAGRPAAHEAQTALVVWLNHPPQPLGALFALVNPLFRPVPLLVLAVVLGGWVVLAGVRAPARVPAGDRRLDPVAELLAQVLKRVVDQPRPTAITRGSTSTGTRTTRGAAPTPPPTRPSSSAWWRRCGRG